MNDEYDVFEILPDKSLLWRVWARGEQRALELLKAAGIKTPNECFAIDLKRQEIIGRVNEGHGMPQINANENQAAAN
jgi:serine/threonine-protein kinase RIO1